MGDLDRAHPHVPACGVHSRLPSRSCDSVARSGFTANHPDTVELCLNVERGRGFQIAPARRERPRGVQPRLPALAGIIAKPFEAAGLPSTQASACAAFVLASLEMRSCSAGRSSSWKLGDIDVPGARRSRALAILAVAARLQEVLQVERPVTRHHYMVPAPTPEVALRTARSWGLSGKLHVAGRCSMSAHRESRSSAAL
jgi:hypothetical protein